MEKSRIFVTLTGIAASNLTLAATPALEIGGEYQMNITNSNDGLNDKDRGKQIKTTSLNLKGAKIIFKGKVSDEISLTVLYKAKESELERYYLTNKIGNSFELTIGKQKIKTYGLHRKLTSSTTTPVIGAYLDQNPLKDKLAIDASYKLAGTLSLQIVEDYSNCKESDSYSSDPTANTISKKTTTACQSWNLGNATGIVANSKETQTTQKQPAVAIEWMGAFGDFSPLIQYAIYDYGKSNTASLGLRYKSKLVDTYLDYTSDTRNNKGIDPNDATKSIKQENKIQGIVAYVETQFGDYSPFLHVSNLETKPYKKPGSNDIDIVAARSNTQGKLDKNEMTFALGAHYEGWGAFYRPFINVTSASGTYVDSKDSTKDKTLAKSEFVAGLIGKF